MSDSNIVERLLTLEVKVGEHMKGSDARLSEMKVSIDAIAANLDKIRSPKWLPIIGAVIGLVGLIGGAGTAWVNLRLRPQEDAQVRSQKELERLYDEVKDLRVIVNGKIDGKYVDEKIAFSYDRLKSELKTSAKAGP